MKGNDDDPRDRLYLAYGSNTNRRQMEFRCPEAVPIGAYTLPGFRLVFRGAADVVPCSRFETLCVLWRIPRECESALDVYEDFPTVYVKDYIDTEHGRAMIYRMVADTYGIAPPSSDYYQTVARGYEDFNLDSVRLEEALRHSEELASSAGFRSTQCRKRFID